MNDRFDYEGLREFGVLGDQHKTLEDIEKRICQWLGIKNIYMYDSIGLKQNKPVKADLKTFSNN